MDIQLGTLNISPAHLRLDLLAEPVQAAVATMPGLADIGVAEIDPELSDTAAFCEQYHIDPQQAANCVVLQTTRADIQRFAACVILASTRADVNGIARRALDARKASFAPMDKAVSHTAMEYGAITPIGLPSDWTVLVDKAVTDSAYVLIGSGIRKSKLIVPGDALATLPSVLVLEGLGKVRV